TLAYPSYPLGANMALRAALFPADSFSTRLGRVGKSLLSNEEKELFLRVSHAGQRVVYLPGALVYHRVSPERARVPWVVRRYFAQGISDVVFEALHPESSVRGGGR